MIFGTSKFEYGTRIFGRVFFVAAISIAVLFSSNTAHAGDPKLPIRDDNYAVKYVSQSVPDPVTIEAGETKVVEFVFKNVGDATWSSYGGRHISAYTVEPKYRNSPFYTKGWVSAEQTGLINGIVRPGETGTLTLPLKAPTTPGKYVERFHLAAENHTWVKDGYFFVIVNVVPKTEKKVEVVEPVEEVVVEPVETPVEVVEEKKEEAKTTDTAETYKANRFMQSKKSINVEGGEQVKLIVGFQNVGTATWKDVKITSGDESKLASRRISFADTSWKERTLVLEDSVDVVPGKALRKTVYFRAPKEVGNYDAQFTLHVDGNSVSDVVVKVAVTDNAPLNYKEPVFDSDKKGFVKPDTPRLSEEARIRVGIGVDDLKALHFISYEDDYIVYIGKHPKQKGILKKRKIAELRYEGGFYSFKGGGMQFSSEDYIRFVPANDPHAIYQLMNHKRPLKRVGPGEFNEYRGKMEYRVGQVDGKRYAVNDTLMEDYVAGIAETSNVDQIEFIKANLVAARTYAYISKGKYPFFDVLGSTHDQLYLGSKVEEYMPNVKKAAEATRGMMVSYDGEIVVTPYFGNSNGSTRSWRSVWGGKSKPWLVPVKANYDAGRRQFGHGVGMSQRDANLRAKNEGLTWDELLAYYYTDTDITWMYK